LMDPVRRCSKAEAKPIPTTATRDGFRKRLNPSYEL
jgi:hypothetical protein